MSHVVASSSNLSKVPVKDKQIIFVPDSRKIYADFYDPVAGTATREVFSDPVTAEGLEARVTNLEAVAAELAQI